VHVEEDSDVVVELELETLVAPLEEHVGAPLEDHVGSPSWDWSELLGCRDATLLGMGPEVPSGDVAPLEDVVVAPLEEQGLCQLGLGT